jgi:putative DNA primase/helicase
VRCGFLALDWLRDNREQLFAEAASRFKAGEDWWSIPLADAARAADERRPEDPWEEILERHLIDGQVYSSRELLGHPLDIDMENQSQQSATRVGRIMRRLGWERFERRTGEGTQKLWRKA